MRRLRPANLVLLRRRARRAVALRSWVRGSEVAIVALAALTGAAVGLLAWGMGAAARGLHWMLYGIEPQFRLSAASFVPSWRLLLVPTLGGLALYGLNRILKRWRPAPPVDPIEANALHGGRLSLTDAAVVGAQTILSNGVGASVGLEAGYAQAGGGLASRLGMAFALRRGDLRVLVGAGTAGAIGAAFDAPLTGAFYAFELVIGTYSIGALFPVVASAVSAALVAAALEAGTYAVESVAADVVDNALYPLALLVGAALRPVGHPADARRGLDRNGAVRAIPSPALRLMLGGLVRRRAGHHLDRRALGRPRRAAPGLRDRDAGPAGAAADPGEVARLHDLGRQRLPRRVVLRLAAHRRAGRQVLRRAGGAGGTSPGRIRC